MDYKSFTINLMNLNRYKKDADDLKLKLEALENIEEGVSGIDYTRIPTRGNPSQKALKRLDLVDKVDALREELYFIQIAIIQIEAILSRMPEELQTMLREKFIMGMTYSQLGEKYGYSDHGMWQMMKREAEKYL